MKPATANSPILDTIFSTKGDSGAFILSADGDECLGMMFAGGCGVKKISGDMTLFMTGIRPARALEAC